MKALTPFLQPAPDRGSSTVCLFTVCFGKYRTKYSKSALNFHYTAHCMVMWSRCKQCDGEKPFFIIIQPMWAEVHQDLVKWKRHFVIMQHSANVPLFDGVQAFQEMAIPIGREFWCIIRRLDTYSYFWSEHPRVSRKISTKNETWGWSKRNFPVYWPWGRWWCKKEFDERNAPLSKSDDRLP